MIADSWRVTAPYIDGTLLFVERDELAARRRAAVLLKQNFVPTVSHGAAVPAGAVRLRRGVWGCTRQPPVLRRVHS